MGSDEGYTKTSRICKTRGIELHSAQCQQTQKHITNAATENSGPRRATAAVEKRLPLHIAIVARDR